MRKKKKQSRPGLDGDLMGGVAIQEYTWQTSYHSCGSLKSLSLCQSSPPTGCSLPLWGPAQALDRSEAMQESKAFSLPKA